MPHNAAQSHSADADRQRWERNRLLRHLPREAYALVRPALVSVALTLRQTLYEPGEPIAHVYFPETATLGIIAELQHGGRIEVGGVGNEGFAGVPVALGVPSMPHRVIVQIPGDSKRMSSDVFRELLDTDPVLRRVLLRYPLFLIQQVAQLVACNRLHPLMQRCARWLLTTHDRVQADTFPLTQGFLAELLAVRRPGVSVTAELLQGAGLIRYSRGKITMLDRSGLEQISCECYYAMREAYARLFPRDDAEAADSVAPSSTTN